MNYLEKLKRTCSEATPGEWYVLEADQYQIHKKRQFVRSRTEHVDHAICEAWGGTGPRPKDAAFIVAARVALPRLIEAVEALTTAAKDAHHCAVRLEKPQTKQWREQIVTDLLHTTESALARAQALLEGECKYCGSKECRCVPGA